MVTSGMPLPPGGLSCIICKMGHRELHKEGTRKCLEYTIGFALWRNRILCAQERVAIFHFMPSFNQHLTSTPPLLSIQLSAERQKQTPQGSRSATLGKYQLHLQPVLCVKRGSFDGASFDSAASLSSPSQCTSWAPKTT